MLPVVALAPGVLGSGASPLGVLGPDASPLGVLVLGGLALAVL
jgi:hypothetical protein